jgi:copper(I)-binding protein
MPGFRSMQRPAFLAMAAMSAACTSGEPAAPERGLVLRDAWARFADSGATSGAYLTLVNRDTAATTLVGVSSPWARAAEIHETMQHGDMAHMQARPAIDIATGDSLVMAPGGVHVMLIDLQRAIAIGDTVPVTLRFGTGDSLTMRVPVRTP